MSQPHVRGTVGPLCICLSFWQRGGRDWAEHSQRLEEHQERAWPGTVDAGTAGREHLRWQGMGSPLPAGREGLQGRDSHSPSMLQRASFSRASKCRLFLLFQVVRGACLGPRGQGMWQVGVEYRGKKYCPRIKLICSHFSLPLPFCMLDPLSGSNALRTNPQSSSWQLMQLTLFPGMRPVVMIFLTWKKPRGSKGHRALCCNVTQ